VDEEVLDRVRAYHGTEAYKKAYRKCCVWVEPLFAEAKDWYGMRRFRLRLLWRVNSEAFLISAGQNLKHLLKKRGWGRRPFPTGALHASFCLLLCAFSRLFRKSDLFPYHLAQIPQWSWRTICLYTDELCQKVFQQADIIWVGYCPSRWWIIRISLPLA
jgi:hypothetical protein